MLTVVRWEFYIPGVTPLRRTLLLCFGSWLADASWCIMGVAEAWREVLHAPSGDRKCWSLKTFSTSAGIEQIHWRNEWRTHAPYGYLIGRTGKLHVLTWQCPHSGLHWWFQRFFRSARWKMMWLLMMLLMVLWRLAFHLAKQSTTDQCGNSLDTDTADCQVKGEGKENCNKKYRYIWKVRQQRRVREFTVCLHLFDQLFRSLIQEEVRQQGVTWQPIGTCLFVNCVLLDGSHVKMKDNMFWCVVNIF